LPYRLTNPIPFPDGVIGIALPTAENPVFSFAVNGYGNRFCSYDSVLDYSAFFLIA
jgi:hypothetical protein